MTKILNAVKENFKKQNMEDIDYLARTIYGEARGESETGQIAVGYVILNRSRTASKRPQFGDGTIKGAVLKHSDNGVYQFTCWNPLDKNFRIISNPDLVGQLSFKKSLNSALKVLNAIVEDPTAGANHYYATTIPEPKWAKTALDKIQIGNHIFMKA